MEDRKTVIRRSCTSYVFMPRNITKSASYSLPGEMAESQQETYTQWDKVSRKLIKQCYTKGTQDISSMPQIKDIRSIRVVFLVSEVTGIPRPWPWPRPLLNLPWKEVELPCSQ